MAAFKMVTKKFMFPLWGNFLLSIWSLEFSHVVRFSPVLIDLLLFSLNWNMCRRQERQDRKESTQASQSSLNAADFL